MTVTVTIGEITECNEYVTFLFPLAVNICNNGIASQILSRAFVEGKDTVRYGNLAVDALP